MTVISMEWATAILVRSSVLMAAALVASWLFGRRRPSSVSAWHHAMLVGLLVLPCGVAYMPRLPVRWLPAPATKLNARTAPVSPPTIEPNRDFPAKEPAVENGLSSGSPMQAASSSVLPTNTNAPPHVEFHQEQAGSEERPRVPLATFLIMGIAAIYVLGIVVGLLRFAVGFHQAASFRRDCTPAGPAWRAASAHWSHLLGIRFHVPIMVTDQLPVPAMLGWLRPVILIPRRLDATALAAQRDAVLLHELSHVARRDAFWQTLARLTAVIYWFHPLMWLVGREVEAAWDAACDSVCAFYLGVGSYSRSLADLAQGLVARRLPLVGLCMARSSRLAGRIRRLTDATNTGEYRPRLAARAVLWAAGLSCALFAAIVMPVERSAVADTVPEGAKKKDRPPMQPPVVDSPKVTSTVSGVVLDEDGSPLPNAKLLVQVVENRKIPDPHHQTCYFSRKLREWKLVSGPDGAFRFKPGDQPEGKDLEVKVFVSAKGRVDIQRRLKWEDLTRGKLADLRLTRGRIVAGRILTPDGQPVQGASIEAYSTFGRRFNWEPKDSRLDILAVKSDVKGKFEVTLPLQTYGELCVDATDWAPQRVAVEPSATQVGDVKMTEGWRLSGKLLNRQGKPVAGQIVVLESRDAGKVPNLFLPLTRYSKTNSKGRFELLPARGEFSVSLTPVVQESTGDDPRLVADGPSVLLAPTVVHLNGSDPSPTVVLQEPESVTLSGRITYEDGRPAEGVYFNSCAECPKTPGLDEPQNGRTYYDLAAGQSDREGRYTLNVPRNTSPYIGSAGWRVNNELYWPWPQYSPKAVQLGMSSMALNTVTEDVRDLDWVLKPDKGQPSRRSPATKQPPAPQAGDEALSKLQSEIAEVNKRGEDSRLTVLKRCFEVEKEKRGSRAAIGALHFIMRAGSTTGAQSVIDGRERASKLLREHYLDHRDLDLLISDFTAGYGGLAESEALLRAARRDSPYPHVRAAASLHLAELLRHRARMNKMFGKMDLTEFDKMKIQMTDEKGITQTAEVKVAAMDEAGRKYFGEQRNQVAQLQKILAGFDERANEQAIVQLLDDVIEHYAGVKAPPYRWEGPDYTLWLTRPVADEENGIIARWFDYPARAAARKFQTTQLKLGHPAPDIVGKDPQGMPAKLSDYRGRVVVLTIGHDFDENEIAIKRCRELLAKHGHAPLSMVSVVEAQPDEPYSAYNKTQGAGITWKVIADPDGNLCFRWCQETSPEVYVIDADGLLRYHGTCGEYSEDFTPLVEELLKKAESTKRP